MRERLAKLVKVARIAWRTRPLEAYVTPLSIVAGNSISFHVSVSRDHVGTHVNVEVFDALTLEYAAVDPGLSPQILIALRDHRPLIRTGSRAKLLYAATSRGSHYAIPPNAASAGCQWPSTARWQTQPEMRSTVCIARVSCGSQVSYALFVVRSALPGQSTKILYALPTATHAAYNPWGGGSFYGFPLSPAPLPRVSFHRPQQLWDFLCFDRPFLEWLAARYLVDYSTSIDLHRAPDTLHQYDLFLSAGHDEYWSAEMRVGLERFREHGGNVAFFGANSCYRRIRFTSDGRSIDNHDEWSSAENAAWSEASTTGLVFSAMCATRPVPPRGLIVRKDNHWAFDGTGVKDGNTIGVGAVGYETDAVPEDLAKEAGVCVLADAKLPEWVDRPGSASMCLVSQPRSMLFNTGTVSWGRGLSPETCVLGTITENVIRRLVSARDWNPHGVVLGIDSVGALRWLKLNIEGNAATWHYRSGVRIEPTLWNEYHSVFGGGPGFVYAIDNAGRLHRHRYFVDDDRATIVTHHVIGRSGWLRYRTVFHGGSGILYAIGRHGRLFFYRDTDRTAPTTLRKPRVIGYGGWDKLARVVSGGSGVIYAVTNGGALLRYRDARRDGTGVVANPTVVHREGWTDLLAVFSTGSGNVFAQEQDVARLLWVRDRVKPSGDAQIEVGLPEHCVTDVRLLAV